MEHQIYAPNMSSNNLPAPFVASSNNTLSVDHQAWHAFSADDVPGYWATPGTTGWVQIDFGKVVPVNSYKLIAADAAINPDTSTPDLLKGTVNSWILQGSVDGITFVELDRQTGITPAIWQARTISKPIFTTQYYRYYRITVTANNGNTGHTSLGRFKLAVDPLEPIWYDTNMTSANAPAPFVVNQSTVLTTNNPGYSVFKTTIANSSTQDGWIANATTGWISFNMSMPESVSSYRVRCRGSCFTNLDKTSANNLFSQTPKSWRFEGSTNGSAWDLLDAQTGIGVDSWFTEQTKEFYLSRTVQYQYYRLLITANNGHATQVGIGWLSLGVDGYDRLSSDYQKAHWLRTDMVSNNAPSPFVASASSTSSPETSHSPWYVFRYPMKAGWPGDMWGSQGTTAAWLQLYVGRQTPVRYYRLRNRVSLSIPDIYRTAAMPKNWTLSGSNNGTTWTLLDTRTNMSWAKDTQPWKYFELPSTVYYNYYRIYITANNGSTVYHILGNMQFGCDISKSVFKNDTTGKVYTLRDNALVELPDASNETILANGLDANTFIDMATISNFTDTVGVPFSIERVTNSPTKSTALISRDGLATLTSDPINISTVKSIQKITITGTNIGGIKHAVSIDDGITLLAYKGGAWLPVATAAEGNTSVEVNALMPAAYAALGALPTTIKFAHALEANAALASFVLTVNNLDKFTLVNNLKQSFDEAANTYTFTAPAAGIYMINYVDLAE